MRAMILHLEQTRETGTLHVSPGTTPWALHFRDGRLVGNSSARRKDSIVFHLASAGRIDAQQLAQIQEVSAHGGGLPESVAKMLGLVDDQTLQAMYWRICVELLDALLHESSGRYSYIPFELPETFPAAIDVPISAVINKLASRERNWEVIRQRVPHTGQIYKFTRQPPPPPDPVTHYLYQVLDGGHTVREMIDNSPASDYDTYKAFIKLLNERFLVEISGAVERQNELSRKIAAAEELLPQGNHWQAIQTAKSALAEFPELAAAAALLERATKGLQEQVKKAIPATRLIPKPDMAMLCSDAAMKLNLTAQEGYALSRLDGRSSIDTLSKLVNMTRDDLMILLFRLLQINAVRFHDPAGAFSTPEPKSEEDRPAPVPQISLEDIQKTYEKYLSQNYYQILNIPRDASADAIRVSFAKLSKQFHADLRNQEEMSDEIRDVLDEIFQIIYAAYRTLSNPESRKKYDQESRNADDLLIRAEPFRASQVKPDPEDAIEPTLDPVASKIRSAPRSVKAQTEPPPTQPEKQAPAAPTAPTRPSSAQPPQAPSPQGKQEKQPKQVETKQEKAERLYNEAMVLFQREKWREAEEAFLLALKTDNRNQNAYYHLTISQLKQGGARKLEDAELNARRAITLDKENADYYLVLGQVYEAQGDLGKAEQFYKLAWSWDSSHEGAREALKALKNKTKGGFFGKFLKR